jgi:hypothetical protein
MKNLIIILLLIITASAFGQMEKTFSSKDSSDISRLINLVLKNSKNKYHLDNINTTHENAIEAIYSDGIHKIIFEFSQVKSGGNHDLNIPDTMHYTFISVTGLYRDVFPFWKKYYQPDAKIKAIAKTTHGKVIITPYLKGKMISAFNKYGDYWELENRYSGNTPH